MLMRMAKSRGDRGAVSIEYVGVGAAVEASAVLEDREAVVEMWLPYADDE